MKIRKGILVMFGIIVLCLGTWFSLTKYFAEQMDEGMIFEQQRESAPPIAETLAVPEESVLPTEPGLVTVEPKQWAGVSFTSQAPTGEWGKSEFQNGCEEASVLMVAAWRTGRTYAQDEAKRELITLARFQEKKIGQGIDTDAADTAEILLRDYFGIAQYEVVYDFTPEDLKQATARGLIIVPTNGQVLKNPNFTRPGPLQHMLVVTGYDAEKKEFVTNDPGTRRGEGYRYPEATLYAAIREYPTGKHLPIKEGRKAMIVIPPAQNP